MVNFLKNSWDINEEKRNEVKRHLKIVKRTIKNKESRRVHEEKEAQGDTSSYALLDKKVGIPRQEEELQPGAELSSRNARQNFSLQGEKLSPPVIKNAREVFGEPEKTRNFGEHGRTIQPSHNKRRDECKEKEARTISGR